MKKQRCWNGLRGKRFFELDALRGLAALCVVVHHFRLAFQVGRTTLTVPHLLLFPFLAGPQSVMLFFVLSGFVLSIPLFSTRPFSYRKYLVRRFCRIYLPFLAALLISWVAASHFLYSKLPLTPWFYNTWQSPLTWHLFGLQLLLDPGVQLNTAFWSLRYEVELSILLPFICKLLKERRVGLNLAFVAAVYVLGVFAPQKDLSQTLTYGSTFILGAILSLHRNALKGVYEGLSKGVKAAILGAGLICYYGGTQSYFDRHKIDIAITALGAGTLILFAIESKTAGTILRHAVPEYLGRISYSLYLIHGTILFALLNVLYGHFSLLSLSAIYSLAALAGAHLFCIAIEEPTMRLGKRLTGRR